MPHTPTYSWEEREPDYRSEWERQYPNTPWNDVSHGYRYGWEQARDPRYTGRAWDDVEQELRGGWSAWEARNRTTSMGRQLQQSWDELKATVRQGWERAKREIEQRL